MELSFRTINLIIGMFFVLFVVSFVTNYKFYNIQNITQKPKSYVTVDNVDKLLDCLAMNIYREAGNESFEGKVAVAQVTLNRVDNPNFPKDICSVVYQKNIIMEKVICQFSWYCLPNKKQIPNTQAYLESYAVAKKVLLEGFRLEILKDALYFHAVYVNPIWPHTRVAKIGNHIFYRSKI